jgi:5-methylcytosine-specific restriction endonuclease McrA
MHTLTTPPAAKPDDRTPYRRIYSKGECKLKHWAERFYNSAAWEDTRVAFLQSKGYLCERCSTNDNPTIAKIAHHVTYLTQANITNPIVTLSWDNLEALCQECHNREHKRGERKPRYKFDDAGNVIPLPK